MRPTILVDSCSYFRLAQGLHPLLKTPFCEEKHVLGVIKGLKEEYDKNQSLKHKFFWVNEPEFVENRKKCFRLNQEQKSDINNTFYFLRETARDEKYGVSRVDLTALCYALVLCVSVVTDDTDMLMLAKAYDIKAFTSLEIMKVLLDCAAITMKKVRAITAFWIYLKDTPKSFQASYKKLFNESPPK